MFCFGGSANLGCSLRWVYASNVGEHCLCVLYIYLCNCFFVYVLCTVYFSLGVAVPVRIFWLVCFICVVGGMCVGRSLLVGSGIGGVYVKAIALKGHIFNTLPAISLLVVVQLCLLQEISCGEESWLVWFVLFFYIMKSFVPFCYYLFIICIVFILLFF